MANTGDSEAYYKKLKDGSYKGMTQNQVQDATRYGAIEVNKKADMNQDLINEIGKNLYQANDNLKTVSVEVKKQDVQIDKISKDVGDTNKIIKRTDKRITGMSRRSCCIKFLLWLLIILLVIANLITLIVKLTKS